ncbi:MAG: hypothetical protein ABI305_00835 [Tepidiformaceae bacterium]
MNDSTRLPGNASVYELVRARPAARTDLNSVGLTSDYLEFRIDDAARAVGVPIERIAEIADRQPHAAR